MIKLSVFAAALTLVSMLQSPVAFASSEDVTAPPQITYYTLEPDITTNYVTQGKRLGYIRLQVDLMINNQTYLTNIEHHTPLIRDAIIDIVSKQPEAKIKSLAGREEIRRACQDQVNRLLLAETRQQPVAELLFTKFLYQ
ncbi:MULTISPECIES: flagellar basal body-associated protein FliL [unclassified Photobacterium]|uniref:flagellar basal body-associated protein FliL n=1 Tax=unclassified Photobacterium TaxID=2628852 RepID=UPI001EDF5C2B|nr:MULTISPECIES: flagellar basal body-associated protein FliL [unclassified Photobacterium]MCG3864843.1 flagellar basal body-associated protein FliL [Photobacterium sp. Ph6]MCG3876252.1 flagellar basal body-associated protein FliL [Photobacterium sp. Ph5]